MSSYIKKELIVYVTCDNPSIIITVHDFFNSKKISQNRWGSAKIIPLIIDSEVPEQPIDNEVIIGVENRIKTTTKYLEGEYFDYIISIENGVCTDYIKHDVVYDMCAISTCKCDHFNDINIGSNNNFSYSTKKLSYITGMSPINIFFPTEYYYLSSGTGRTQTVGSFIEKKFNYSKDTWRENLRGISRYQQIFIGLEKILC